MINIISDFDSCQLSKSATAINLRKRIEMESSKKLTGVWLDTKQAFIITFTGSEPTTEVILSEIEDFHPIGGSRSKTPWGPMENVPEKKYEERRKHQQRRYFDEILAKVKGSNHLYLFGPADLKDKLKNEVLQRHEFRTCKVKAESADSMTDPQKIAQVKKYYKL